MALKGNISIISYETGGDVEKNKFIVEYISGSQIIHKIIDAARFGTPLIKLGEGYPKVMITAGVHGNELSPQIAALWLIDKLLGHKLRGTFYVIPFAIPYATMENSRRFNGIDMNRAASKDGVISNNIIKTIKMLDIGSMADFHSTKPKGNPGEESIFCSKNPCYESFRIANHMIQATSSRMICYENAGTSYSGALEDECNLAGIPAVTCEVVSNHGEVDEGSPERSYLQMISYLKYFGII